MAASVPRRSTRSSSLREPHHRPPPPRSQPGSSFTLLGDDRWPWFALNEGMGMLTGYESPVLVPVPACAQPACHRDMSAEALVREWESELKALRRRAALRLLRADPGDPDRAQLSSSAA